MKKKVIKKSVLINFILDETGSMIGYKDATISGFNEYINSLKKNKNINYRLTLTKFNSNKVEVVYSNKLLKDAKELNDKNYLPDYMTPLYDAIAKTIKSVENKIKKSDKVLCIIMTDGQENASKEYGREDIFKMIKDKEKQGNWTFVYLGANQDSWLVSQSIGLQKGNVIDYNLWKTQQTYSNLSVATDTFSKCARGQSSNFCDTMDKNEIQ